MYAYPIYREKTASSSRKNHIRGSCDKGLCPLPQPCDSVGRHVVELELWFEQIQILLLFSGREGPVCRLNAERWVLRVENGVRCEVLGRLSLGP